MANEWVPRNEYGKKLQDPRWQARRLEILQRDRFQCQTCGDCRSMLHVHHVAYCPWGRLDPWDEPESLLVALCAACHEVEPQPYREATYLLTQALGNCGIRGSNDIYRLSELIAVSPELGEAGCAARLAQAIVAFVETRARLDREDELFRET